MLFYYNMSEYRTIRVRSKTYDKLKKIAEDKDVSITAILALAVGEYCDDNSSPVVDKKPISGKKKLRGVDLTAWENDKINGGNAPMGNGNLRRILEEFEATYDISDDLKAQNSVAKRWERVLRSEDPSQQSGKYGAPSQAALAELAGEKVKGSGLTWSEKAMIREEMRGCLEADDCDPDPASELGYYIEQKSRRWPGDALAEQQLEEARDEIIASLD